MFSLRFGNWIINKLTKIWKKYIISVATYPKFSSKIIESSSAFIDLIGSYIFITCSTRFIFAIFLVLDELNIQQFLKILVKINFENEENLNENVFNFIKNVNCVFLYIQKYNPGVFSYILNHIYSEKGYFKEIFICNLHNLDENEILKYIRIIILM